MTNQPEVGAEARELLGTRPEQGADAWGPAPCRTETTAAGLTQIMWATAPVCLSGGFLGPGTFSAKTRPVLGKPTRVGHQTPRPEPNPSTPACWLCVTLGGDLPSLNLRCPNPSCLLQSPGKGVYRVLACSGSGRGIPPNRPGRGGLLQGLGQGRGRGMGLGLQRRANNPFGKVEGSQGQGRWRRKGDNET